MSLKDFTNLIASDDFISMLNNHFQGEVNLLRLKLLEIFVLALCIVQTVGFEKLTLIVMIAFVWCYKIGLFIHENIKSIEIKKH